MKTKIATLIAGILLIGMVTAGLVPYLSNSVTGSVEVEGPVFYLDGHISGVYHNLLINEIPGEELDINWNDGQRVVFKTEALNLDGFYKAKFNFTFYAKTNQSGNEIQMRITKVDDSNHQETICDSDSKAITATINFANYELYCESNSEIFLNNDEGFAIEIWGTSANETDEYWISTGDDSRTHGASRIEVSAI